MPPEKIRFRCYACHQLIEVGSGKLGKVVACPKCKVELLVPDPNDLNDGPLIPDFPDVGEIFTRDELEAQTNALNLAIATESWTAPVKSSLEKIPSEPLPDLSRLFQEPEAQSPSEGEVPAITVPVPTTITTPRSGGRRSDVTLPRVVVLYWSMFVILAQVASFVAGLMIGHHVWKT